MAENRTEPIGSRRVIIWVVVGVLLIAAGARATVPMEPVPMSLQTLAVLSFGGLAGGRIGAWAAALYLVLVLVGAPLLSNGIAAPGTAFLDLKSGGYVIGFIPAAFVAGFAGKGVAQSLAIMALAHLIILVVGAACLARHIGAPAALEHGVEPFIWGALVKTFVAAAVVEHFAGRP